MMALVIALTVLNIAMMIINIILFEILTYEDNSV